MSDRPYVICHMIATIDGKILSRRWKDFAISKSVSGHYEETGAQFEVGSWLVGTATLKEFCQSTHTLKAAREAVPTGDFVTCAGAETHAIGLDAKGALRFTESEIGGDPLVIVTTEKAGDKYLAHLRELGISYLICGKEKIDLAKMLSKLHSKLKLKKVLLEGGGLLNGAMLQAGLIDEVSQIFVPIIDGGGPSVSGLYDLPGGVKAPARARTALKLIAQETLKGGAIWLRFKMRQE
jgi:2,5-diamino-6-(ribosylamino)-4(3H)-pyrimidinone 5'-phosphate reductase